MRHVHKRWRGCEKCGFWAYTKSCYCPTCGFTLGKLFPSPSTEASSKLIDQTVWRGKPHMHITAAK